MISQAVSPAVVTEPVQNYELWSLSSYASNYFGVRIAQPTESRTGLTITDLTRGIEIMELLDQEEKSRGYILKKDGYRGVTVATSTKGAMERASIGEIRIAIQNLITTKVEAINALQSIYPVESSCGGAQVFIEKVKIALPSILGNDNINAQSYVTCFYQSPEYPGVKRPISLRYYRTPSGKCQYQNFASDLKTIFGETIASSIADHRKVLKLAVSKFSEVTDTIGRIMVITPDEIAAINTEFGYQAIL